MFCEVTELQKRTKRHGSYKGGVLWVVLTKK